VIHLRPAWAWIEGRLRSAPAIEIGDEGHIVDVALGSGVPDAELENVAILPGFVNAHSHAFQWGLRGQVQRDGQGGSFFSWRDRMFDLVAELDIEDVFQLSRRAYRAMRSAGYTTIGEFHYLHHRPDGSPYQPETALAEAVVEAARSVDVRLCLLHSAYLRPSGVDPRISPGQVRFLDPSAEAFLERHDLLSDLLTEIDDPLISLGVAPHSIRTVSRDDLWQLARETDGPLHIHLNEQAREVDEALAEYGERPLDVVAEAGLLGPRTTLIHMTQSTRDELELTLGSGAGICFCPTTERDLGDGIGPSRDCLELDIPLSIGSDSQVQIEPFAELRLLEAHERLRHQARLLLPSGPGQSRAARLLEIGTSGGARALRVPSGAIRRGAWADLVEVDLTDPDLEGFEPDLLPDLLVFSATPRSIRATWVAGRRHVAHPRVDTSDGEL
jgi:formimidoylglutamate deiminase